MTPYFSTIERILRLHAAAQAWKGTPFHAHARVRGAGVDCVNLFAVLLAEAGWGELALPGRYSIQGGCHQGRRLVIEGLSGRADFLPLTLIPFSAEAARGCCGEEAIVAPRADLRPGDALCFNLHGREHVGVFTASDNAEFTHVYFKQAVTINTLNDPSWGANLVAAFRPLEVA